MKSLLEFHDTLWNSRTALYIQKIYQIFLFISGAAIVLAMLATVLMRYVFRTDLFGMEEVILTVTMWFYFLGAANGSKEDTQIRADIVNVMIKNRNIKWSLQLITRVIEIVVLIFFIVMTVRLLVINYVRFPTTPGLKIPFLVPQAAMLLGFLLMLFYAVGHFIIDLCSRSATASEPGRTDV